MRLSGNRYDEIEQEVVKLFEKLNISRFPIDCFEVCNQLGIAVIPYSKLSQKQRMHIAILSEDGFNVLLEIAKDKFVHEIYYNDSMPDRRTRFTIMHEVGHIILDHTEHSDLGESEANHFARYALAPPPLVHKLKVEDYLELSERFDISRQCALNAMDNYTKWLKYGSSKQHDYEIALISLFQPFLV